MATAHDDAVRPAREGSPWSEPRRPLRSLTIATLVVTALVAAALAVGLYPEASYAFEPAEPNDIGALDEVELTASLANRFVRARVALDGRPAVSFRRAGETERRLVLAAETPRFVDHAVPEGAAARFVPPRLVAGRLARVGELGLRHRGLSNVLESVAPGASTRGWVLVDGEEPRAARWVAALEAMVIAFFVVSVAALVRILRRKPAHPSAVGRTPSDSPLA